MSLFSAAKNIVERKSKKNLNFSNHLPRVVLVGDRGVGKRSIVSTAYGAKVDPAVLSCELVDLMLETHHRYQTAQFNLILSDDPSHATQHELWNSDSIYVLCYSVVSPSTIYSLRERWWPEIRASCPKAVCLVVGTKIDIRTDAGMLKLLDEHNTAPVFQPQADHFAKSIGAICSLELSSVTKDGLAALFDEIGALLLHPATTRPSPRSKDDPQVPLPPLPRLLKAMVKTRCRLQTDFVQLPDSKEKDKDRPSSPRRPHIEIADSAVVWVVDRTTIQWAVVEYQAYRGRVPIEAIEILPVRDQMSPRGVGGIGELVLAPDPGVPPPVISESKRPSLPANLRAGQFELPFVGGGGDRNSGGGVPALVPAAHAKPAVTRGPSAPTRMNIHDFLAPKRVASAGAVRPGENKDSQLVAQSDKRVSPLRPLACTSPDVEAAVAPARKDSGGSRNPSTELLPAAPNISPGRRPVVEASAYRKESAPTGPAISPAVSPSRRPLSERVERDHTEPAIPVSSGRPQRPVSTSPYTGGTSPGRKDQSPITSPVLPSDRISPPPARPPPDVPAAGRAKSPPMIKETPASPMPDRKPSMPVTANDLFIRGKPPATEAAPAVVSPQQPPVDTGGRPVYHSLATIPYSQLKFDKVIGDGAHGQVLLAKYRGSQVAVKKLLMRTKLPDKEIADFLKEIQILAQIRHPNIILFMGTAVDEDGQPCIVNEYMSGNSLYSVIYKRKMLLTNQTKLRVLTDVARGLAFLHSNTPPIAHRDLKTANVLVDEGVNVAKIADFGTAKETNSSLKTMIGSPMFMAPEILRSEPYGLSADVYSFALVAFELFTYTLPYPNTFTQYQLYKRVGTEGFRPTIPTDTELVPTPIAKLIEACWGQDPATRLTMEEVLETRLANLSFASK